jgi:hypothetical protein
MGGDDSQKLLPWRGIYFPSGAQTSGSNYEINNVTETAVGISWVPPPLASLALASATARLGHFWKAQVGQFYRAPKRLPRITEGTVAFPSSESIQIDVLHACR